MTKWKYPPLFVSFTYVTKDENVGYASAILDNGFVMDHPIATAEDLVKVKDCIMAENVDLLKIIICNFQRLEQPMTRH